MTVNRMPEAPGYYMWFILDLNYLKVGVVQVIKDRDYHLEWLRKQKDTNVYIYENSVGETLTMYHMAQDGIPPLDKDNKPFVDDYLPFDMDQVN
jgi:hypothetical protein